MNVTSLFFCLSFFLRSSSKVTSTSCMFVTWGAVYMDSDILSAVILLTPLSGTLSMYPNKSYFGFTFMATFFSTGCALSRSWTVILPSGPEPFIFERSMPFCFARFLTAGVASIPVELICTDDSLECIGSTFSASCRKPTTEPVYLSSLGFFCLTESLLSPSINIVTSGSPTFIVLPASKCIFRIVPDFGEGISTTALSVSTSHNGWSTFTESFSFTNHFTISPSCIPSPTSGNIKSYGILELHHFFNAFFYPGHAWQEIIFQPV